MNSQAVAGVCRGDLVFMASSSVEAARPRRRSRSAPGTNLNFPAGPSGPFAVGQTLDHAQTWTLNAGATVKDGGTQLSGTMGFDVINLFDAHYAYRIANGFNGSHWAPGRSVFLRASIIF
jgi:hypothetical protein